MIPVGLRTRFDFVPEAAGLGFDFLELPLTQVCALSNGEFEELATYLRALDLKVTVLYDMLPSDLRITGHRVSAGDLHAWLESSFLRAKALGTDIVVLDAAASRHVPNGYDFSLARRQLGNFLRMVQGHAASAGLKVAVQNLRRAECNLINTVSEAALVPALLHLDNVGVLADTVQMELSSEPFDSIVRSGEALLHVHAGNALDRTLPAPGDGEDYVRLFRQLRQMNYHGGVSCVAEKPFTKEEAKRALDYMKFARTEV